MPDTELALLPTKIDNEFVKDEYLAGICNFRTLESGLSRDQKKGDKSKEIEKIFFVCHNDFSVFSPSGSTYSYNDFLSVSTHSKY